MRLKAIFSNERNELFPSQFVNARLLVDVRRGVTVVPAPAIQRGPQGTFVYVVKADGTAAVRPVTVGEIQGGEASIKTGLSSGEARRDDAVQAAIRYQSRVKNSKPQAPHGKGY